MPLSSVNFEREVRRATLIIIIFWRNASIIEYQVGCNRIFFAVMSSWAALIWYLVMMPAFKTNFIEINFVRNFIMMNLFFHNNIQKMHINIRVALKYIS